MKPQTRKIMRIDCRTCSNEKGTIDQSGRITCNKCGASV